MRPGFARFIVKHGGDFRRRWRLFLIGLTSFGTGLSGVMLEHGLPWLANASIILMLCGFTVAMYGYIGIFASRFIRLLPAQYLDDSATTGPRSKSGRA